eukprot:scaffold251648_cov54-Attheya_sp.AAC.1
MRMTQYQRGFASRLAHCYVTPRARLGDEAMCPRSSHALRTRAKRRENSYSSMSKKTNRKLAGITPKTRRGEEGKPVRPPKRPTTTWNVSTWAKHLRHSSVEKNGNAFDKAALPERTRYSNPCQGEKRTRQRSTILLVTRMNSRHRVAEPDRNPPAAAPERNPQEPRGISRIVG